MNVTHLGPNTLTFFQDLEYLGIPMGTRMTICRDSLGRLFVHSPNKLEPKIIEKVNSLGKVSVLFSPNLFHHMYVQEWQKQWADAVHVAPIQLSSKRPDLKIDIKLGEKLDTTLDTKSNLNIEEFHGSDFEFLQLEGTKSWNEWICYFKPDKVLICTDLLVNFQSAFNPKLNHLWPKIYTLLTGQRDRLCMPAVHKILVKNPMDFQASVKNLQDWDFEKVVIAHGELPTAPDVRRVLGARG